MANIYLIKDSYFKEQYPMYNYLDMSKFYSTLLIEQNTTLENWTGTVLYSYIIDNAETISGDALQLLKHMQYALIFLTALSLIKLSPNSIPKDSDDDRKLSITALEEKAGYMKNKIINYITNSTALQTILSDSGDTTDNAQPDADTFESPVYYWR